MNNSNMMNMVNNNNNIDPWEGNFASRLDIMFELADGKRFFLHPPKNITVKELIDGFIKKFNCGKKNIYFWFNGSRLRNDNYKKITEVGMQLGSKVYVFEYRDGIPNK